MPLPVRTGDVTIVWADVLGLAPELSPITTVQQGIVMNTVQDEVTMAIWGDAERLNRAALYLAAHLATGMRLGLFGQPLNEVQVGATRMQFKQRQDRAYPFDQSKYGMEYLRMVRLYMPRFAVSGP